MPTITEEPAAPKEAPPAPKEPTKEEAKVVTPLDHLKYLMSTTTILINNSNVVVEKLNKIDRDLDYLYNKVGHVRPAEEAKESETKK